MTRLLPNFFLKTSCFEKWGPVTKSRSSYQRYSLKKGILRNFTKFTGKHLCQSLFFNKVAKKGTLAQLFSSEFCEISKNTFFREHLWTTTSFKILYLFFYDSAYLKLHICKHSCIVRSNHPEVFLRKEENNHDEVRFQ